MALFKKRRLAGAILAVLFASAGAAATVPASDVDVYSGFFGQLKQQQLRPAVKNPVQAPAWNIQLPEQGKVQPQASPQSQAAAEAAAIRKTRPVKITSTADLAGERVLTVRSLLNSSFGDGGGECTVTPIAGTDSILIEHFWNYSINLKAAVDVAAGTVTIPNQVVGQMQDNGDLDIAFCQNNGKPDRKKAVTGRIMSDGSIEIADWWGIYVVAGVNKDRYAYLGNETKIMRPNATMSMNFKDGRKALFSVVVDQRYDNRVYITNFGNYGMTVYIDLNTRRGGLIPCQVGRQYPENKANFLTCGVVGYDSAGNPQGVSNDIVVSQAAAGVDNTLQWGNWTAISQGTQLMYWGAILDGKIEYEGTFQYPKEVTGFLEGEGTETSPYLVKTADDLIRLAQGVNSVPASQYNAHLNGVDCARVYEGKHFRLANDLDLGATLFTPVGADPFHYFAGTFDGDNHTISHLNISSTDGLAALFGLVDEKGTVKNLRLESPNVECAAQTAGTVAGWCFGTIDNCHVNNANVKNTARIAGGLAGVAHTVTNSTVSDSYILGANGNPGGIAGQVDGLIENCHVRNTQVVGATGQAGLPAGGVVAALTGATGRNLSFTGTVDTRTYQCTMSTGGVVGVLSDAILEQSFAAGTVTAGPNGNLGRRSAAGGVVGKVYGSVIDNCYFTGKVSTYTNRCTGGITGWLNNETVGENTVTPVVRNSWTASVVTSETYLYDKEKEARETVGWIEDGCTPELTNLYYDNQWTNLNSTRFGATTAQLTAAAGPKGFDDSVWQFTAGQYPRLKVNADSEAAALSASAVVMPDRSSLKKVSGNVELHPLGATTYRLVLNGVAGDKGHFSTIEGTLLKITDQFGTDTIRVANGSTSYDLEIKIAPVPFAGEGTETNPYLISTKDDMMALGNVTTKVKQYFPGDHFLMTNDIDMQNDTSFLGICNDKDAYCKFAGIFDGGNHTIRNMKFDFIPWDVRPENAPDGIGSFDSKKAENVKGLFGRLAADGVIRNIIIDESCSYLFWARSGAIVGQNEGLVENCRNHADILAYSSTPGGIVGENRKGTVRRCYNDGTIVSGYNSPGGIVATGNGRVEECVNVGEVRIEQVPYFPTKENTMKNAGGIQGENNGTDFFDCANFGPVKAYSNVGGIAGMLAAVTSTSVMGHNELHRVLNVGNVTSTDRATIGALGGTNGTTGQIEAAYWDAQIVTEKAHGALTLKGAQGLTTARLISGTPLEGFNAETWDFTAGKYPVPAWCADEPALQHARSLIVNIPEGFTAANLQGSAALSGLEGHTWQLEKGADYAISGAVLTAPTSVEAKVSDVLTGKSGSYTRVLPISTNIAVPLAGKGTAEDSYLISTAEDWNALAAYITTADDNFAGKTLKVTADIDFTDKAFSPIFSGTHALEGTLDGNGKTVKGIAFTTDNTFQAPIGTVEATGVIRNLKMQGEVKTAKANTGAFTAKVYGTVENCENLVNLTATSGAGHSGFGTLYRDAVMTDVANRATIAGANGQLAGISHNVSAEGAVFTRVANYGTIKSTSTASSVNNFGGLVATCYPATFTDCHNEGTFEFAKANNANQVGGLIGNATSSTTPGMPLTLTGCYNTSDITAHNIVAGIVANNAQNKNTVVITDCYNRGNITSATDKSTSSAPTAGITAFFTAGSQIKGCRNYGKITAAKNVFAGGIVGSYKGTGAKTTPSLVFNCHNEGEISADGNQGAGIMGISMAYTTIDSCSNVASVSGGFGMAGILANISGEGLVISRCWNEGNIDGANRYVGGIGGWGNVEGTITECFNTGNITSHSDIQGSGTTAGFGIGGIAGYAGSHITRCYNTGAVTGATRVGGIVGSTFKNRTKLAECYNTGKVTAPEGMGSALVGTAVTEEADWNTGNTADNCFFLTDSVADPRGKALTLKELAALDMGERWIAGDDYTLPIIAALNVDAARLWAACVVLDGDDTFEHVTCNFNVGAPEGLVWTASEPVLSFQGTRAVFSDEAYKGPLQLTAAIGDRKRTFTLTADKPSGVEGIDADNSQVTAEEWYTTDGIRIDAPAAKGIYIVVRHYADGSKKSAKVIQ